MSWKQLLYIFWKLSNTHIVITGKSIKQHEISLFPQDIFFEFNWNPIHLVQYRFVSIVYPWYWKSISTFPTNNYRERIQCFFLCWDIRTLLMKCTVWLMKFTHDIVKNFAKINIETFIPLMRRRNGKTICIQLIFITTEKAFCDLFPI